MVRPQSATTFPIHVFKRAANIESTPYERVGNRDSVFTTTLLHLTERFNGKEVFLVGTCNQSTMLAQRTQKLIEELKPDTVMVQTSQEWWDNAKLLKYVDSQDELNHYSSDLDRYSNAKYQDIYYSSRRWLKLFRFKLNCWLYQWHFGLNHDFNPLRPGLEVKSACEAAEKVGAKLDFLGPELDGKTWARVQHETRIMNIFEYISKCF